MDIKDLLMLKKINVGIMGLTVGLVSIFGLSVVASVFSTNPYQSGRVDLVAASSSAEKSTELSTSREPASVAAAAGVIGAVTAVSTMTYDFNCGEHKGQQSLQVMSSQMRIRGVACGEAFDHDKTEIVNTSNGYSAVVFKTGEKTISSDYIQLSDGLNHIKIQLRDRQGRLQVSELLVSRNPTP